MIFMIIVVHAYISNLYKLLKREITYQIKHIIIFMQIQNFLSQLQFKLKRNK